MIKTEQHRQNDYYGNYTMQATKKVDLEQLYNELVERKLISELSERDGSAPSEGYGGGGLSDERIG